MTRRITVRDCQAAEVHDLPGVVIDKVYLNGLHGDLWACWVLYSDGMVREWHWFCGMLVSTDTCCPGDAFYPNWWAREVAA
jgi:hypothetical protein